MNACTLKVKEALALHPVALRAELNRLIRQHEDHARVTTSPTAHKAARRLAADTREVLDNLHDLERINATMRLYVPASVAAESVLRKHRFN